MASRDVDRREIYELRRQHNASGKDSKEDLNALVSGETRWYALLKEPRSCRWGDH